VSSAVDFSEWVAPGLKMPLGDRTYTVPAPSVERAKKILALAVRAEIDFKIVTGELPQGVADVLATITGEERPGLGTAAAEMVADGVDVFTLSRMHTYSVFYWARGREYADAFATLVWAQRPDVDDEEEGDSPKALTRLLLRSGRGTASESPLTTT